MQVAFVNQSPPMYEGLGLTSQPRGDRPHECRDFIGFYRLAAVVSRQDGQLSTGDGRYVGRKMINYAPFSRTKVRYKLIGKPPVPKTGVGLKALCEFESRPHRHNG